MKNTQNTLVLEEIIILGATAKLKRNCPQNVGTEMRSRARISCLRIDMDKIIIEGFE